MPNLTAHWEGPQVVGIPIQEFANGTDDILVDIELADFCCNFR